MPRDMKSAVGSQRAEGGRVGRAGKENKGRQGRKGKRESNLSSPSSLSPFSRARRGPRVAIVGAGRMGTALALALGGCGYEILALFARRAGRARRAAKLLGTKALALSVEELDRLPPADLLFITTPDDAIAETARLLTATATLSHATTVSAGSPRRRARTRVALHASGALSSEELAPLRERGYAVGSLHPLVSVSDATAGAAALRGSFYCIEGDAAALRVARRLVRDLGGESFSISARDKPLYHAAAVITSGHTVALFDLAARLLARCGLSERRARAVLLPLLQSTLDNLSTRSPAQALTGTFARGDAATVRKHLDALARAQEGDDDEAFAVYALLGRRSLRLAEEAGADATALNEIAHALKQT